jgi:hypothetical protein
MALNVLLVTGTDPTSTAAITGLLEGRGDTVTTRLSTEDAPDSGVYDVIVVGTHANLTDTAGYAALATPIVDINVVNWTALLLASSVSAGTGTDIERQNTDHPIIVSAGVGPGQSPIYTQTDSLRRIDPGQMASGGVRLLDDATGTDGRIVLAAFDEGVALTSGNAPARRVAYGAEDAGSWNALGQAIFLASVDWAAGVDDSASVGLLQQMHYYYS